MNTQRKDKAKVIGETWTQERIASFLDVSVPPNTNKDFYLLYHAYKHMRLDDFSQFLTLFNAQGFDTHATNEHKQTVADIIATHKKSRDYLNELKQYQ